MARDKIASETSEKTLTCGLVMPISSIDGCTAEHWLDVKNILSSAITSTTEFKFDVKLVSDQDDVGVIQKRIVQNLYSSDIVVCDVSCKNPNVMFELGMRLAFDKPTVIVKDDHTDYSFDTSIIEHLTYPRDLRFTKILSFKESLADKVSATWKVSQSDPNHSTFLKSFGQFRVAELEKTVGSADEVILDMLQELSRDVAKLRRSSMPFDYVPGAVPVNPAIREHSAQESVRRFLLLQAEHGKPFLDSEFEKYIEGHVAPWLSLTEKKRYMTEAHLYLKQLTT